VSRIVVRLCIPGIPWYKFEMSFRYCVLATLKDESVLPEYLAWLAGGHCQVGIRVLYARTALYLYVFLLYDCIHVGCC